VAPSHKRLGQFKDGPDVDLAASGDITPRDLDTAIWADEEAVTKVETRVECRVRNGLILMNLSEPPHFEFGQIENSPIHI
jgi:hypothetical protein